MRKSKDIRFLSLNFHYVGRDTIDDIATCYALDAQWIESPWRRDLPDSYTPAMVATHPPIQ